MAAALLMMSLPALASEASRGLIQQGADELGRNRFTEALALFQQAAAADPQDGEAYFLEGAALNRLGRYGGALESLQQSEKLKTAQSELYFELGWAYLFTRDYERAIEALTSYEKTRPGRGLTQEFLGRAWLGLDQDAKAEPAFQEALRREARLAPTSNYYLGAIALRRGDREQAAALLEDLSRQKPASDIGRSARALLDTQRIPPERPWSIALSASGGYDSNVIQLDPTLPLPAGLDKRHAVFTQLSAAGAYDILRTSEDAVSAGYGLSGALYNDISEFNTFDNRLSLAWKHRLDQQMSLNLGVDNRYGQIGGNSQSYDLTLPLSLDVRLADWAAIRPSYTFLYSENFLPVAAALDRDGTSHAPGVTLFLRDPATRITGRFGYSHRWDETDGSDYDLESDTLSVGVNWPLPERVALDASYSRIFERYDNPNSFTGFTLARSDDVDIARAELSKTLNARWSVWAAYNYIRDDSDLAIFDYTRQTGTAGVTFRY
jgi:tetratricopeptide (TPR) repeat protein